MFYSANSDFPLPPKQTFMIVSVFCSRSLRAALGPNRSLLCEKSSSAASARPGLRLGGVDCDMTLPQIACTQPASDHLHMDHYVAHDGNTGREILVAVMKLYLIVFPISATHSDDQKAIFQGECNH